MCILLYVTLIWCNGIPYVGVLNLFGVMIYCIGVGGTCILICASAIVNWNGGG